jgi:hypothetical protein
VARVGRLRRARLARFRLDSDGNSLLDEQCRC